MSQVAVVTDSTASLPERMYERYQILMVPYYVHLGGRVARDMVDIKQEEFNVYLAGLPDGSELPRTATPGPGDYVRAFGAAAKRAEEIITHAASRPEAEKLRRLVEEMVIPVEVLFCELCPALTVHTGPGTVGLCYAPESV